MVKTYLRYSFSNILGQVTGKVKPQMHPNGRVFFTAMNEYVIMFSTKSSKALKYFKFNSTEITCLEISKNFLFVGYSNGNILQLKIQEEDLVFESKFFLHKTAITYLEYDENENQLLSGAKDTFILLWDIISESVLFKFQGHKDQIMKCSFYRLDDLKLVVSCSKDNTLKIWNRTTQECVQTIANLINKINYFEIVDDILILGTYDTKISLYKFIQTKKSTQLAHLKGSLQRKTGSKIISLEIIGKLLVVFSKDNTVEFYKILSDKELEGRLYYTEFKKNDKEEDEVLREKAKKLMEIEDYNLGLKFFSLFNFFEENELYSIFFCQANKKEIRFYLSTNCNVIEVYKLKANCLEENLFKIKKQKDKLNNLNPKIDEENISVEHYFTIDIGHKEIIRFVKFSSSNTKFLSVDQDCIRVWNYKLTEPVYEEDKVKNSSWLEPSNFLVGSDCPSLPLVVDLELSNE